MAKRVNGLGAVKRQRPAAPVGIQSIEIGIELLRVLAAANTPLTLTSLASSAGMAPGKAHKYLTSLIRGGLVAQTESGGRYSLGPFALDLGLAALSGLDFLDVAQSVLDDLRDQLRMFVGLEVWGTHGPTFVRWAETAGIVSLVVRVGTVVPLLMSASGRIFAAYLDRRLTHDLMREEMADVSGLAYTTGLRTMADVEPILAEVRARRMATITGMVDPALSALAAPVFDHSRRLIATIAVVGLNGRLDVSWDGEPARRLELATRSLSRRLGAPPNT